MNYTNLSEHQLISLANKKKLNNSQLNIEWRNRYGMNYPYKLDIRGNIVNCVLGALVGERECDQLILEQANKLRERRRSG